MNSYPDVTRFEVIDHRTKNLALAQWPAMMKWRSGKRYSLGRVFSAWDCTIKVSIQDHGKTLKVFVND